MDKLLLLLLFCDVSSSVRHSLKYSFTSSTGLSHVPQFMAVMVVDDIQSISCDSNKTLEIKHDAWKRLIDDNRLWSFLKNQCEILPNLYKSRLHRFMQLFNQSGGVHILQVMRGCEWNNMTGELSGFMQCGYDGEDLMTLNLSTKTWIPLKPQAAIIKQEWDADKVSNDERVTFITQTCPQLLKMYLGYGNKSLLRTVCPSVSLLQTSPSSQVSCHATGFYPDRATMFWTKDGEELHEDVDHGEILPNQDGTFQMTVDLDISSVKPEDWTRYDCVFQLYGVKDDIITKLDKAVIRTNWEFPVGSVVGVVVGLMLLSVCITGLFIWRKKKNNGFRPANRSR